MPTVESFEKPDLSDAALMARLRGGDPAAAREVIKLNNQRLFRAAWSVLKNRLEAEEAIQETYLKGFASIAGFKGDSSLSTWLTRIVINEAKSRKRANQRRLLAVSEAGVAFIEEYRDTSMTGRAYARSPDDALLRREVAARLERAIAHLPEAFRLVFVLREVEELSVKETAQSLQISPQTVKTRLFRAKRRLRLELTPELKGVLAEVFRFGGADCEALTGSVLGKLKPWTADRGRVDRGLVRAI